MKLPVSGLDHTFRSNDAWLHALSYKELFTVRRGVIKFRGYVPKKTPLQPSNSAAATNFTDGHFKPHFEQKGLDMRIGLDVAAYSANRAVDRIVRQRRYRLYSSPKVRPQGWTANRSYKAGDKQPYA